MPSLQTIVPAQPGFEAGWCWLSSEMDKKPEQASLQDVGYRTEPIIAWVIVTEVDGQDEPEEYQTVRAVGVFGDIGTSYFVKLPDGQFKLGFEGTVGSLDDVKQKYLDQRRAGHR